MLPILIGNGQHLVVEAQYREANIVVTPVGILLMARK